MAPTPASPAPADVAAGVQLDGAAMGLDFADRSTLLIGLASDLRLLSTVHAVYRRLLERPRSGSQVVVAAPPTDTGIGGYLQAEGVEPDAVVFPVALPVRVTPTLLLVDSAGVVSRSWAGLLNADREQAML